MGPTVSATFSVGRHTETVRPCRRSAVGDALGVVVRAAVGAPREPLVPVHAPMVGPRPEARGTRQAAATLARVTAALKGSGAVRAARGTRLRPITHTRAKQLVPVANKPILFYAIEAIRDAGITDIGVDRGRHRRRGPRRLGDGSAWDVSITYIPQEAPLGLAHAVKIAEEFMAGEPFVMYLGDNLLARRHQPLHRRVPRGRLRRADPARARARTPTSSASPSSAMTATSCSSIEKPENPPSDLALVGVYLFARVDLRGGQRDRALGRAASSRSPTRSSGSSTTGRTRAAARHRRLVEGHRPARRHARGQPHHARRPGAAHRRRGDDASTVEGARRGRGRARTIVRSSVRGPADHRRGREIDDAYIGPYTAIADGVVHPRGPRSSTRSCWRTAASRTSTRASSRA